MHQVRPLVPQRSQIACSRASSTKSVRKGGDAPADDAPREDVDDEGHVDEAAPRRHVGQVRHPELIRPGRGERSTRSSRRSVAGPDCVVVIHPARGWRPGGPSRPSDARPCSAPRRVVPRGAAGATPCAGCRPDAAPPSSGESRPAAAVPEPSAESPAPLAPERVAPGGRHRECGTGPSTNESRGV